MIGNIMGFQKCVCIASLALISSCGLARAGAGGGLSRVGHGGGQSAADLVGARRRPRNAQADLGQACRGVYLTEGADRRGVGKTVPFDRAGAVHLRCGYGRGAVGVSHRTAPGALPDLRRRPGLRGRIGSEDSCHRRRYRPGALDVQRDGRIPHEPARGRGTRLCRQPRRVHVRGGGEHRKAGLEASHRGTDPAVRRVPGRRGLLWFAGCARVCPRRPDGNAGLALGQAPRHGLALLVARDLQRRRPVHPDRGRKRPGGIPERVALLAEQDRE